MQSWNKCFKEISGALDAMLFSMATIKLTQLLIFLFDFKGRDADDHSDADPAYEESSSSQSSDANSAESSCENSNGKPSCINLKMSTTIIYKSLSLVVEHLSFINRLFSIFVLVRKVQRLLWFYLLRPLNSFIVQHQLN